MRIKVVYPQGANHFLPSTKKEIGGGSGEIGPEGKRGIFFNSILSPPLEAHGHPQMIRSKWPTMESPRTTFNLKRSPIPSQ